MHSEIILQGCSESWTWWCHAWILQVRGPFRGPYSTCVAIAYLREEIPRKLLTIQIWFPLKAHHQYHSPMTSSLCNISVAVHLEPLSRFQRGRGMWWVRCSRHMQTTWRVTFKEDRAGLRLVEQGKMLHAERVRAAVLNQQKSADKAWSGLTFPWQKVKLHSRWPSYGVFTSSIPSSHAAAASIVNIREKKMFTKNVRLQ